MRRINIYITIVLLVILGIYIALLDTLAKPLFEKQATEMYGAEVSVDSLSVSPFVGKVTLHQLQVTDRRKAMRNLAQADRAYIDIDILKLAQDIIEIDEMELDGLVIMNPRSEPGVILRPLLPEDSDIATAGLPTFDLPDADALIEQQREKLENEINSFRESIEKKRTEWEVIIASLPDEDDIKAYKARIRELKESDSLAGRLQALQEVQSIYAEVNEDVKRIQSMRQEFRGDLQRMREQVDAVTALPQQHVDELISSLGLSEAQMAQIGSRLLRGDLSGLMQQVLAPLAYSAGGDISVEDSTPIFIRHAKINGSLLPSAAGLSASGELQDFAWPLELADQPALLQIEGSSLDGGTLAVDARIDHRGSPDDAVTVSIDRLPLRNMTLAGTDELSILMQQTLANIEGGMRIEGDALSGEFTQHFAKTLFDTELGENAGQAARVIAAVLDASTEFRMQVGFSGTLQSPELRFDADLGQLIESTLRERISMQIGELTRDLANGMSEAIGPEIQAARDQFATLERLQTELEANLQKLNAVSR
jgi:hypothetical protein